MARKKRKAMFGDKQAANLHFVSRGFSDEDRARIGMQDHADKGLSTATKATLSATPSPHQKMVLVETVIPPFFICVISMGLRYAFLYWFYEPSETGAFFSTTFDEAAFHRRNNDVVFNSHVSLL